MKMTMEIRYSCLISFLFYIFVSVTDYVYSQDVLGCGGFVKSEYPIDFTLVEIKLYNKQGALKFKTDCAPNNGYYLIPVYDKGDYVIKVEPPEGWYFEPNSVALNIDGVSDVCSQSKDINFHFKGFFVKGTVLSRGSNVGPSGVTVTLSSEKDAQKPIQELLSQENGAFYFEKVVPGKYVISGNHQKLIFDRKTANIHVEKGGVSLAENNLIVSGYNVNGCVIGDDGEAIHGVHFILFGKSDALLAPKQCDLGLPKAYDSQSSSFKTELTPLCHVTSLKDGCFNFPVVVPGEYVIVPFYKSQNIKFDVIPSTLPIKVEHSHLKISPEFKVEGFSVGGRVLSSPGGKGLSNAAIIINGKLLARSKVDGTFHLENMRAGSYEVQIQADKMKFNVHNVKINPNSPNLQDIIPSEFEVCGELEGDELAKNVNHRITFTSADVDHKQYVATNSPDGKFCTWLTSGHYTASVSNKQESLQSIIFLPARLKVIVKDAPISNLKFSQFKATVTGRVECLQPCSEHVHLILAPVAVSNFKVSSRQVHLVDSKFTIDNVIPGKYELSVIDDVWCWDTKVQLIQIGDNDVKDIVFKHKGYWLTISTTHATSIRYTADGIKSPPVSSKDKSGSKASSSTGSLDLQKGRNKFCLDKPAVYTFQTVGCHIFSNEHYVFDTFKPTVLTLEAIRHLVSGAVISSVNTSDIRISVKVIDDETNQVKSEEEAVIGPLTSKRRAKHNDFEYTFTYWATPLRKIELQPLSPELLFYPEKKSITVLDDCLQSAVEFVGRKGLFLEGRINPPLAGVKITVFAEDGSLKPITLETSENGRYRVGPLHGHSKYEVQAEKLGYILSKEKELGHFTAFKLAEIVISVEENLPAKRPLAGVIISISGGEDYRQNRLTQEDGKMTFSGLGPGQYFLRAMMKEYQFDPPSKMIEVSEGEGVNVILKGHRVAYSVFGKCTTLIGETEKGVAIEAVGKGECDMYHEEVISEDDGSFRIRDLKPNCSFAIGLKTTGDANSHIERSSPSSHLVKIIDGDVGPIHLIIFRPIYTMDVSGMVLTTKEFYNHLKVRLTGENGTQHVRSLSHSNFFQFLSLPMRGQMYTLALEPTLSRTMYNYALPPEITFKANDTYRHFKFHFHPTSSGGEHEISHGSYLALTLAIVVALVLFNYPKVVPFINKSIEVLRSLNNPTARSQETATSTTSAPTSSSVSNITFDTSVKKKMKSRKI